MTSREPQVITEPLGGSPLSRVAQNGDAPAEWYPFRPGRAEDWRMRVAAVRGSLGDWWSPVREACAPSGEALARITSVVEEDGVVVTTGQQPGLFGGPVYTWSKALTVLAFADQLAATTGVPVAPVFWAGTDDADFNEASWTMVAVPGGAERLELAHAGAENVRLADVPLADCTRQLERLRRAAGSTVDAAPLDAADRAYRPPATVGSAYVTLLRALLEPLGIVVLDAAHESISRASHPVLARALRSAARVDEAISERVRSIRDRGFDPQVRPVDGLTLVFQRNAAVKQRVALARAASVVAGAREGTLSPNVLLRPVVERALLPTVAYMAGPGELAYFAQVSAVADALGVPHPLAVPRWSATILEPHVAELLEQYGIDRSEFETPHAVETRLARAAWPSGTERATAELRAALEQHSHHLRQALESDGGIAPPSAVDALQRTIEWRLERLARRVTAGVKQREAVLMRDLGTIRGSLYPGGMRQERALNLVPLLARYGMGLLERMRDDAAAYARGVVGGEIPAPART
jgi:uncharacterized protein YllA (UPF0747 family)